MSLPNGVEGGGHEALIISCLAAGVAIDLTGVSSITGKLFDLSTKTSRAIAGSLTVSGTPTEGNISWAFAAGDLVEGRYLVQLTINYASGLPARNYIEPWEVTRGL